MKLFYEVISIPPEQIEDIVKLTTGLPIHLGYLGRHYLQVSLEPCYPEVAFRLRYRVSRFYFPFSKSVLIYSS